MLLLPAAQGLVRCPVNLRVLSVTASLPRTEGSLTSRNHRSSHALSSKLVHCPCLQKHVGSNCCATVRLSLTHSPQRLVRTPAMSTPVTRNGCWGMLKRCCCSFLLLHTQTFRVQSPSAAVVRVCSFSTALPTAMGAAGSSQPVWFNAFRATLPSMKGQNCRDFLKQSLLKQQGCHDQ